MQALLTYLVSSPGKRFDRRLLCVQHRSIRRVRATCHRQAAFDGIHCFVELAALWCMSNREYARRITAAGNGGRDVITDHISLAGIREPGQHHRPSQLLACRPRGTSIRGGDVADIKLTIGGTTRLREVVIRQGKMSAAAGCGLVYRKAGDKVVNAAANRIGRNALYLSPVLPIGGGTKDDIVGATTGFKAAILPCDINYPRAVDLGGRQVGWCEYWHVRNSYRG